MGVKKQGVLRLPKFLGLVSCAFISIFGLFSPLEAKVLNLPTRVETLENGLKIYLIQYPSPGAVAYQIPVHVGSGFEIEEGKTGFAHFFEHLMFRGTKTRSSKVFEEAFIKLGVEYNAWTDNDMTNYHGVAATKVIDGVLEVEADRFQNLSFDEASLRDEAGAVLGEYNKNIANPDEVLDEKLRETAFTVNPYRHTTMGYLKDVQDYPNRYKDVWPFFKRYYRPGNVRIVLAGDIDLDRELASIKKHFGNWKNPEGLEPLTIPEEPEQTASRRRELVLDRPAQSRLQLVYKVPAFTTASKDSAALALLAEIYFSETSDFQKTYRFDKALVDSVSASANETLMPGTYGVYLKFTEAGEAKMDDVIAAVEKTIGEIAAQGPSETKLSATKERFKNASLVSLFSDPEELASKIAWYTNFENDLEVIDRLYDRYSEVTAADIQSFAQKYLKKERQTLVILKGAKP